MENKKCLQTRGVLRRKVLGYGRRGVLGRKVVGYGRLGAALIIVMATLIWASGAAASTCKAIHVFTGTGGAAHGKPDPGRGRQSLRHDRVRRWVRLYRGMWRRLEVGAQPQRNVDV